MIDETIKTINELPDVGSVSHFLFNTTTGEYQTRALCTYIDLKELTAELTRLKTADAENKRYMENETINAELVAQISGKVSKVEDEVKLNLELHEIQIKLKNAEIKRLKNRVKRKQSPITVQNQGSILFSGTPVELESAYLRLTEQVRILSVCVEDYAQSDDLFAVECLKAVEELETK